MYHVLGMCVLSTPIYDLTVFLERGLTLQIQISFHVCTMGTINNLPPSLALQKEIIHEQH